MSSVEKPYGSLKPVKRSRGPHIVTFLVTLLQPVTYQFFTNLKEQPMKAAYTKHPYPYPDAATRLPLPPSPSLPPPEQVENVFIDALVQACSCRQHSQTLLAQTLLSRPPRFFHRSRRRYQNTKVQSRGLQCKATPPRSPSVRMSLSREEYLSMLDWYREPFSTQAACIDNEPFRPLSDPPALWSGNPKVENLKPPLDIRSEGITERSHLQPLKPSLASEQPGLPGSLDPSSLLESSTLLDQEGPADPLSSSLDDVQIVQDDPPAVTHLYDILKEDDCTHEAAFEAYSSLPFPGISQLSIDGIRLLFRRLSTVEKRNEDSMLRYLSVVDDMKSANIAMTEAEWNSAIAFCGLCFTHIKAADVEVALRTWKEMEGKATVKSGRVTFNILLDMATKAGKFVLAEMILEEMKARKLKLNRYARVGLIYYHGLRADGEAVRKAYRDFVEAGEIVDTVVLNCVIASLIRAGEPDAAERVYERMKRRLANYTGKALPSLSWRETRDLGRVLDRAARMYRQQPARLQQIRNEQLLAPNLRTYTIFIEHHASQTGELRRIVALLTEMHSFNLPMHGRIFLKIFKGFSFHGGIRYTSWTKARLESVWNTLLAALEESDMKIMKWTVIWTVRAFEKCAGRERTLEIWEELRRRWKPHDPGELEMVLSILRDVLNADHHR